MAKKDFLKFFIKQERKTEFIGLRVTKNQKENMLKNAALVGQSLQGYLVGLDKFATENILTEKNTVNSS